MSNSFETFPRNSKDGDSSKEKPPEAPSVERAIESEGDEEVATVDQESEGENMEEIAPEQRQEMLDSRETAALNLGARIRLAIEDETVRAAAKPALRLMANIGVTMVDAIPWVGEAVSWAADLAKFSRKTNFLTPDVSKTAALTSEVLEVASIFGIPVPSHAVETGLQFWHDKETLFAGARRLREIFRRERKDYQDHQQEIDEAMGVFGVQPVQL